MEDGVAVKVNGNDVAIVHRGNGGVLATLSIPRRQQWRHALRAGLPRIIDTECDVACVVLASRHLHAHIVDAVSWCVHVRVLCAPSVTLVDVHCVAEDIRVRYDLS